MTQDASIILQELADTQEALRLVEEELTVTKQNLERSETELGEALNACREVDSVVAALARFKFQFFLRNPTLVRIVDQAITRHNARQAALGQRGPGVEINPKRAPE